MSRHLGVAVTVSVLACATAIPAGAGERQQISSTVFGDVMVTPLELGARHQFVTMTTQEVVVRAGLDEAHPLQNLSGRCGASVEVKEGTAKGGGYCVYTNPKGGKWVMSFNVGPEADSGTFEITGIEGNTSGWKGSGKWGQTVDFGERRFVQRWTGSIERP